MRAQSARLNDFSVNGLKYKVKVNGMNKYHDKLKYGDFPWKIKYAVFGEQKPNANLANELHFDTLLKVLRQTDWAKTPLYEMYLTHGRWVHEND